MTRHDAALRKVFDGMVMLHPAPSAGDQSVTVTEWLEYLKPRGELTAPLSRAQLMQIFSQAQFVDVGGSEYELVYAEFCEAMGRLTIAKSPIKKKDSGDAVLKVLAKELVPFTTAMAKPAKSKPELRAQASARAAVLHCLERWHHVLLPPFTGPRLARPCARSPMCPSLLFIYFHTQAKEVGKGAAASIVSTKEVPPAATKKGSPAATKKK